MYTRQEKDFCTRQNWIRFQFRLPRASSRACVSFTFPRYYSPPLPPPLSSGPPPFSLSGYSCIVTSWTWDSRRFVHIIVRMSTFFTSSFHDDLDQSADLIILRERVTWRVNSRHSSIFHSRRCSTWGEVAQSISCLQCIDACRFPYRFLRCSYFIRFVHRARALWLQSNFALEKLVHNFQKYNKATTGALLSHEGERDCLVFRTVSWICRDLDDSVRRIAFVYREELYRIGDHARVRILSDGLIMSVSVLVSGRSRRFSHARKARGQADHVARKEFNSPLKLRNASDRP